jgi:hypothetical protein
MRKARKVSSNAEEMAITSSGEKNVVSCSKFGPIGTMCPAIRKAAGQICTNGSAGSTPMANSSHAQMTAQALTSAAQRCAAAMRQASAMYSSASGI